MTILLALFALQEVDRDALREFLEKKSLAVERLRFDLDYLATLPPAMVASHSHPARQNGKLQLFLDVQKDPLSFPARTQAIAARCAKSLPDLFAAADEVVGRAPARVEMGPVEAVAGYPDKVGLAIGKIRAAIATKDPATIGRAVLEGRADLVHTGRYESPELTIDFDGDDAHSFDKPATGVRVFIDMRGNDRYEGAVAAANGGIDLVFDFAGNDVYESKDVAQAAAVKGTALLYDAAGDDRYVMDSCGQAFAREGVAALVDVAGNDTYEITWGGQGYGQWGGFAILADLDGNDSYLGRDPLYGHEVTAPAPQDAKHNANMVQGAGQGYNASPHKAGGVGILFDARGDDTYRSGCWSQGVGYFMGIGALIDLEGDDTYRCWVYVLGTGAHGGFGLLADAKGDDAYDAGGWNGPGMAVDFGCGIFLEGAGHDRYASGSNGFGSSIGLGIAIFQDSGGDDDYAPRDGKLGFGRFYEREDYNDDKQVSAREKEHWAVFLDLAGSDRYPKNRNVARWDPAEFCGGLDRASPRNALVDRLGLKDWEDRPPADVLAELKKAASSPDDLKALAEFGFAHGFERDGSEALFRGGGSVPGATYEPKLRLWVPPGEREWTEKLLEFDAKLAMATVSDLAAAKPLDGPKWVRRAGREILAEAVALRKRDLRARVDKWIASLKPLLEKRATLDEARAKDEKKLRALWAARKQSPVKVDPALRDLDKLDPKWRADVPLACNLDEESLTLENLALNEAERAALVRSRLVGQANESAKEPARTLARELNAFRAMFGRAALVVDGALCAAAEAGIREPKKPFADRARDFDGATKETTSRARDAVAAVEAADRAVLDAKWTCVGAAAGANGQWSIVVGRRK
ncbi:MAG: hypothetical protein HYY17_12130 [Planctomycetes bacterium]|nr:hypothetical protein [Planctomycetota bacterium]